MDIIPVTFYSLGNQLVSETKHEAINAIKTGSHLEDFLG